MSSLLNEIIKAKPKLVTYRSGGFVNRSDDRGRIYIDLPIIEAKKLMAKLKEEDWRITLCWQDYAFPIKKGQPMPQTKEYWEKRALMDQELILEQKTEIGKLKQRINKLEQRRG